MSDNINEVRARFEAWAEGSYHLQRMGDKYRSAITTDAWRAWQAAVAASPGGAAMTGPIIPANKWPTWADRHCWDADGDGYFYGAALPNKHGQPGGAWREAAGRSGIPMPAGWDWRVPVMRPDAEAKPVAWMRRTATHKAVDGRSEGERIVSEAQVYADDVPLYAAPQSPTFEWARPTNRRQKAVELLLAHGYHWHDGEWIAPTQAINLEKFRDAAYEAWRSAEAGSEAEGKIDRLLALIDEQASPKGGSLPGEGQRKCRGEAASAPNDLESCSLCGLHFTSERELAEHRHEIDDDDDDERQPAKGEGVAGGR